jgi:hypothetical protein
MKSILLASSCTFAILGAAASLAQAALLANTFDGVLYDINVDTGAATNPRSTGISNLAGITFGPNGVLYGLTTFDSNSLFSIDPATGASAIIGTTGLSKIFEGDLDFDPTTGILYGVEYAPNAPAPPRDLFTINPTTGAATIVGDAGTANSDLSAMAFSANGTLFTLDTETDRLLNVNKSTAAINSSVNLSAPLGPAAGMDFDPATGILYVVEGGTYPTVNLYTLNPTTGVVTVVGPTGLTHGLAGLTFYVPEPSSLLLAVLGVLLCSWHRAGC